MILLLGLVWAAPALGQDSLEAAKRRELEEIQRRARESREAATQLKGKEDKAITQLRRTERDLTRTRKDLRALEQEKRQLDQRLGSTVLDLQRSTLTYRQYKERLAARLRGMYKYGSARELEFLLSPRSFAQLLARWDYMVMVADHDRRLLEDVQARKELVEATKQRLERNLGDIQTNTRRTNDQKQRLDKLREDRTSTVKTIQAQRKSYEAAAAELEKTAAAIKRLLSQLERQRRGRDPQPYHGDFAKGQGRLDWPVNGGLVGRFGPEKHPKWGTVTPNNGIDIEVPIGTGVRAVARARVDYTSEDFGTYGQIVVLNHGDGYYTLYGHLSEILVSVGEEVASGQIIARSGESGSLKGSILHFEVRQGGTPLDPEKWLR